MAAEMDGENGSSNLTQDFSSGDHKLRHYFALYTYHANRPSIQEVGQEVDRNDSTVANFLQREATSNRDFSLSVIATDLIAEQETELREFIFKRLSRGTVYGGSGNVNTVDISNEPLSCYYYLLRQQTIPDDSELDQDEQTNTFYTSIEYVICLLMDTSAALELFRPELDAYSEGLLAVLDSEAKELIKIQHYLEQWYQQAAEYVCRCTDRFQDDLSLLIHTALLDEKLNYIGGDEELRSDVTKFVQVCSLSDLLQHMSDSDTNSQGTSSSEPTLIDLESNGSHDQADGKSADGSSQPVQLVFDDSTQHFHNAESSPFCEEWTRLLLTSSGGNPANLRQIIEDCKLRTIQDLNTLKRLVRQAESDHYALYRAFAFLRDCGNGAVLLRHIWKDENTVTSQDTQSVLHVLEEFISQNGCFAKS
ncbi:protein Njmu-R1-like [Asterias rubens]|uniref:protein Njmu-R1-like n=1 Tax=Asterias rubens TaxID=7604 RepID=UPI0014550077|nr:protein Njmu-R1-like [Asterias rubens]